MLAPAEPPPDACAEELALSVWTVVVAVRSVRLTAN
jgi:hypothetical protein